MSAPLPATSLTTAPTAVVGADGAPCFGTYRGAVPQVDWSGLGGDYRRPLPWRLLHHKRWLYAGISSESAYLGMAIVDVGWATTCFAYLYDRIGNRLAREISTMGLPGLSALVAPHACAGAQACFRAPGLLLQVARPAGDAVYRLTIRAKDLHVEAALDAGQTLPGLVAITPIAGGVANCTHKSAPLPVRGRAVTGERVIDLDGAWAGLDHTDGLLARHTAWRWASAQSERVGFNLQAGFNGDAENALWLDGKLIRLGAARFDYDPRQPMAPWHVATDDGLLDLTFRPLALRREDKELGLAMSRYAQPVGLFSGTVRAEATAPAVAVHDLLGVTEDHASRW